MTVALLSAPLMAQAWVKDRTYKFTVLHTNDHHGRFWNNEQGEYGLAAQKTMMDQIRYEVQAHGGATLILSGGDINTGVPESDLQDAEPDFRGMNLIGYDAMAIGNHEFDNPLPFCVSSRNGPNSRCSQPIFIRKAPGNGCLSPMRCLTAWG